MCSCFWALGNLTQLWWYSLLWAPWHATGVTVSLPEMACCCSVAQSCLTLCDPWTAARQVSLSFTISQSLLKLMSIELVMLSNHLQKNKMHQELRGSHYKTIILSKVRQRKTNIIWYCFMCNLRKWYKLYDFLHQITDAENNLMLWGELGGGCCCCC